MPLKLVPPRKRKSPFWSVRGTYLGVYVDRTTKVGKKNVAIQVLKKIEGEIERCEFAQPAELTFAGAALTYMKAGGERTYIRKLLEHFKVTPVTNLDQAAIDAAAVSLYPNGSAATRNRQVYTPVSAVLRDVGHRLDLRRPRGSGGTKQTTWLWPEQAFALFKEAEKIDAEFATLMIVLCYTGMRLGEALKLTWGNVRLDEGFAYVPDTKNCEPRAVFLPPVALDQMRGLSRSATGRVFRFAKSGHLYSLLKAAAFKAGVDLPERSAFHIFRHTYATWMRREAGLDTKGLVATGAWKDRKSADRYEHVVVSEEARKAALLPTPEGMKMKGNS
jgi:integrase